MLTEQTFAGAQEKIKEGGKVLVDFWAPWCGPCRAMAPTLEKFASENTDVQVIKVNVDENPDISELGIKSIPTLIAYSEGSEIERLVGAVSSDKLKKMFP